MFNLKKIKKNKKHNGGILKIIKDIIKPRNGEEDFFGEYILVYSVTDKKVGKHIDEILGKPRFKREPVNKRTRVIWICENPTKPDTESKEPKESKEKSRDEWRTEWPMGLGEAAGVLPNGKKVETLFLKKENENPTVPVALKLKLNINDYEKIEPLKKIGHRVVSAILFSDGAKTDSKLPLLIGALDKLCPGISIAAEYTQPEHEEHYRVTGADEVFSREVLLNHTMALSILECQASKFCWKKTGIQKILAASQFLGQLAQKPAKGNDVKLGMRSAFLRTIRLDLKNGQFFHLDKNNWPAFRAKAIKGNVKKTEETEEIITSTFRPLAFFSSPPFKHDYKLRRLREENETLLSSGDSILFLTHSGKMLGEFGEEIIRDTTFLKQVEHLDN